MKETKMVLGLAEIKSNQLLERVAQKANQLGIESQQISKIKITSDFVGGITVHFFTTDHIRIN